MKKKYKNILFSSIFFIIASAYCNAQIQVIRIPYSDSTIIINVGEIEREARRVGEQARRIAAEVQIEKMEEMEKLVLHIADSTEFKFHFDSLDIRINQEEMEKQIKIAEEYVRLQEQEIRKITKATVRASHFSVDNFATSFNLDYSGKIDISEDEENITSISRGGKFVISKSTFGNKRKVEIQPDENGKLIYNFYVGNSKTPFDPDGKNWLADILPEVLKSSSIAAENRIEKQMKKGGVDKTLLYINRLSSQGAQVTFYKLLISRNDITSDDLSKITKSVSRNISSSGLLSDYYSESFAIYYNKKGLNDYFNGIKKISSSYEKSECLAKLIEVKEIRDSFDKEHWENWLNTAQTISSSYELSRTLREAFRYNLKNIPARSLEETLVSISSSYEKANTVEKAFESPNNKLWNESQNNALLNAARSISSSYEKKNTLEQALENWKYWSPDTKTVFFKTATTISSSSELASLLEELENYKIENKNNIHAFYAAASRISSSYELSSVLRDIAGSNYFHKGHYKEYLTTAAYISSSSELSDALEEVGGFIYKSKDASLIELYKNTANRISSTYDREKAMEALQK